MRKLTPIEQEAYDAGYRQLTHGYLTCQKWMLENVVEDMRQGGIDHIVIPGKTFEGQPGQAVWRKPSPGCAMDDESDSE